MHQVNQVHSGAARQRGFSLMEVSIVTAVVLLIAIVGIPAIGAYVIENKVPKPCVMRAEAPAPWTASTLESRMALAKAPVSSPV